jgi:hypothetical protein
MRRWIHLETMTEGANMKPNSGQSCLIHRGSPNLPGGMGTPHDRVYIPYLSENRFLSLSTKS